MNQTENGKRKTENAARESKGEQFSAFHSPSSVPVICSACGTEARRENARFCLVCGKLLLEGYQPLDALRASYRMQGKTFSPAEPKQAEEIQNLFEKNENSVSQTAWACVVYSFVPYLGILFVPFAFLVGSFGVLVSYRKPYLGGRKLSLVSVGLSFVVLVVQISLWWLLYFIPEIGKQL
jgi:hypothetical protein